jgi:hypothetical protein
MPVKRAEMVDAVTGGQEIGGSNPPVPTSSSPPLWHICGIFIRSPRARDHQQSRTVSVVYKKNRWATIEFLNFRINRGTANPYRLTNAVDVL